MGERLLARLGRAEPDAPRANEPYPARTSREKDQLPHTVPLVQKPATRAELDAILLEDRNDLISSDDGVRAWADRLAPALAQAVA